MSETNYDNQAPIFRFLYKHKWLIFLSFLIVIAFLEYRDLLRSKEYIFYSANLFITSDTLDKKQLNEKVKNISDQVLNEQNLNALMIKYDLFSSERAKKLDNNSLLKKLRSSINLYAETDNLAEGSSVSIMLNFRDGNPQIIKGLVDEVIKMYESDSSLKISKYTPFPQTTRYEFNWEVTLGRILFLVLLVSFPLIVIWEIPNLFYSPKTKETVFRPLKSDWQNELTEAKLRNQIWKAFEINIRYSFAFLSAMLQRSPIGSLMEFVRKIAS